MSKDGKRLAPGHYVVVLDPQGEVNLGYEVRARVLESKPDPVPELSLEAAVVGWLEAPINDHGTPYVPIPEDFTPAEQSEFVDLVREPRLVTRDEQIAKLRSIIAARTEK